MVYLKAHTHFADTLTEINERDVHRGRLETLLRQDQFDEIASICRYDSGISAGFSSYVIEKAEVEQIIRFLILLNSGSTEKFIFQYPVFLSKHTVLDINRIANARDYSEFLEAVEGTPFYEILKDFRPDEKGRLAVSDIENKLYALISKHMIELIRQTTKGHERQELMDIFRKLNDYRMMSRIIRMKKYYHMSPEVLRGNILTEYGDISPKLIDRMCKAETVEEVFKILHSTRYGKLFDRIGYTGEGDIGPRVQYQLAKRYLHFSDNPSVVMISFILLSETELMNVISLIEGIRYRLDPKTIRSLLIR